MRWLAVAVLARFTLCAGFSEHTNFITKNITECPDVGYFFERVVRPNAIEPDCQLCFCKEGGVAICYRREGKRCQEKYSKSSSRHRRAPIFSKLNNFLEEFFHHRRITPKSSTAEKSQIEPLPNINEKCKPFASVSKGCPPTDWCLGCTVCNCERNGKWDCHTLSFCSDKEGEPIHSPNNSFAELLHASPNKSHIPHNIRNKRKPEMYNKRNSSQISNVRKSSMINRAPDSRISGNPTTRSSQKLPIQRKKEKHETSRKMQQSLTNKNIVRNSSQISNVRQSSLINRAPDSRISGNPTTRSSQKLPIQRKKEKHEPLGKMQQSLIKKNMFRNSAQISNIRKSSLINRELDSRISGKPTTRNSQKLPIHEKKEKHELLGNMQQSLTKENIVRPVRHVARKPRKSNKVSIKNLQRKFKISQTTTRIPPLNMNSSEVQTVLKTFIRNVRKFSEKNHIKKKRLTVTKKTLNKITKPTFTSKSKAGPCRADGKQDSCKPNNFTKLEQPRFNIKNKIKQETPLNSQNIKQYKTRKEQNERNLRAHRARSRSNSKKPLLSKSDSLNNYTYQNRTENRKFKEYTRKERASGSYKQEINGQKNVNQQNKSIKNTKSVHPVTGTAWKDLTNSAGVFDRRKRSLVNRTTSFEYKNITSPEKIQDIFDMLHSKEIVDEVINGSLSIGNSGKFSVSGENLTTNFDFQINDYTDNNSVKHLNTKKHPEICNKPCTTSKLQEREVKVTEMENNKHVLITKDRHRNVIENMLFLAGREIQKKIYHSSEDTRQSNLLHLSRDKQTDIRGSKQTELQRTRRQNKISAEFVPLFGQRRFFSSPFKLSPPPPPPNFSLDGAIELKRSFFSLPFTLPPPPLPPNISLDITELKRIRLDLKKNLEDFKASQLLIDTDYKKLRDQIERKNTYWMDKRTNTDDIRSEELEQVIKKIKYLFRKDNLMQNAFLKDLYDVLNKFTDNITSKNYSSNTGHNRENDLKDIELHATTITENLNKIKMLARDMTTNRGRRKREIGDEVSFDYILMALEYLLKNSYNMANGPPERDGIDILIDAIRSAPDIELTKRKLYDSQVVHTVPSKVAASSFRSFTATEESIAIDGYSPSNFEPRYLKESARVKTNKEKMNIIEKELEKEVSDAEPEKEISESEPEKEISVAEPEKEISVAEPEKDKPGKEPARDLPSRKFEKVEERSQNSFFEIKNKTASLNFFEIDEDEDESAEDNYFKIMKRTSNSKSVTEASKPPEFINLNVYQEYRPTKDSKIQTGSESDQPHAASTNSNEEEPRRNNDIKGNVDEKVSLSDFHVTLTQPATTEEPRTVPIRTETLKTETKPTEETSTVRQFNWYKELDTVDEYTEDKSKQEGNKLIWAEQDLDDQNKNTINTRTTTLTTTQAYSEQTYPSRKRKKHKITPHKVMLKKEMNLLKSLEYDNEREEDPDSSETRSIMFSLY